jgi:hypothetical protein
MLWGLAYIISVMREGVLIEGIRYTRVFDKYSEDPVTGRGDFYTLFYADFGGPKFAVMPPCSFFMAEGLVNGFLRQQNGCAHKPVTTVRLRDTVTGGFLQYSIRQAFGAADATVVGAVEPKRPVISSTEFYERLRLIEESTSANLVPTVVQDQEH